MRKREEILKRLKEIKSCSKDFEKSKELMLLYKKLEKYQKLISLSIKRSRSIEPKKLSSIRTDMKKFDELFKGYMQARKYFDTLSISDTAEELASYIETHAKTVRKRLKVFVKAYNLEFSDAYSYERGRADSITWALLGSPLMLYALQINGPAIVELHAIIERFALRDTVIQLANPKRQYDLKKLIARHTLPDFASRLHDLGIWDKDDVKFVNKLNKLRNGISHKNPLIISKLVSSGKNIHVVDIDYAMTKYNVLPLMLRGLRLLMKLSYASRRRESSISPNQT